MISNLLVKCLRVPVRRSLSTFDRIPSVCLLASLSREGFVSGNGVINGAVRLQGTKLRPSIGSIRFFGRRRGLTSREHPDTTGGVSLSRFCALPFRIV